MTRFSCRAPSDRGTVFVIMELFKTRLHRDGTILYTVHGVVSTTNLQDAIDLLQTGVFKIQCELTNRIIDASKAPPIPKTSDGVESVKTRSFGILDRWEWLNGNISSP